MWQKTHENSCLADYFSVITRILRNKSYTVGKSVNFLLKEPRLFGKCTFDLSNLRQPMKNTNILILLLTLAWCHLLDRMFKVIRKKRHIGNLTMHSFNNRRLNSMRKIHTQRQQHGSSSSCCSPAWTVGRTCRPLQSQSLEVDFDKPYSVGDQRLVQGYQKVKGQ